MSQLLEGFIMIHSRVQCFLAHLSGCLKTTIQQEEKRDITLLSTAAYYLLQDVSIQHF